MKKNLLEGLEARQMFSGEDPVVRLIDPPMPRGGSGDYQLNTRWSSTATNGNTGSAGNPITLTWGFVADGFSIPTGGVSGEITAPSILQARLTTLYGSMANAQAVFQSVFDRWSAVSGISYVYTGLSDDGAVFINSPGILGVRPDVRIGGHHLDGTFNVLAYNYFPNSGDMVLDTDEFNSGGFFTSTASSSLRLRNVLAHEHGHGIGLSHVDPLNNTKLMEAIASTAFDGPQFDDILAAQSLYGDPLEKNGRNETAATATDLGTLVNGTDLVLKQQISIANTTDNDYFKFTVAAGKTISFTLQPDGPTYLQGPQNGTTSSFNASAQGNLNLALFGTNGTTLLQNAAANGLGLSESLNSLTLAAGTYYLRANIASGSTQMYKLLATVVDGLGPPTAPDLDAASDLGSSNSDNITSDNTPTFSGSSPANVTIQIFDDTTLIGTTTSNGTGNWSVTVGPLADGVHNITGRTFDGTTLSNPSLATTVTIDTVAPSVVSSIYDRDLTQHVTLIFSDAVAPQLTTSDLTLTNTTTSSTQTPLSIAYSGGNTTANITLQAFLLPNGSYHLTAPTSAVADVAGNALAAPLNFAFTQLAGDANGDGTVSFDDLLIVTQNYNSTGKNFSQGNFNYDGSGIVDFSDLLILTQNYGVSLFQSAKTIGQLGLASVSAPVKRRTNNLQVLA